MTAYGEGSRVAVRKEVTDMKNPEIGIWLEDEAHGCAVAAALNLIGGFDMTIYPPDEELSLHNTSFLGNTLVASAGKDLAGLSGRILLAVSDPEEEDLAADPPRIWIYSPAPLLAAKLREVMGEGAERKNEEVMQGAAVLAFAADAGGIGTSSLAAGTAAALYRIFGERSLYLNLTPCDRRAEALFGEGAAEGEDRFLRMLFDLARDRQPDLGRYVAEGNGVDRVPAPLFNPRCGEFGRSGLRRVAEAAGARGYRYVVLDIGNHLDGERPALAETAYRAVWLRSRAESRAPWEEDRTLNVEAGGLKHRLAEEADRIARAVGGV